MFENFYLLHMPRISKEVHEYLQRNKYFITKKQYFCSFSSFNRKDFHQICMILSENKTKYNKISMSKLKTNASKIQRNMGIFSKYYFFFLFRMMNDSKKIPLEFYILLNTEIC